MAIFLIDYENVNAGGMVGRNGRKQEKCLPRRGCGRRKGRPKRPLARKVPAPERLWLAEGGGRNGRKQEFD